ncbi:uncharacterized protein [Aegilops tauschii subsp. strangulata]|uniref:uncharacterized protein n=1 Tax=Aegilops tauschii subsp. strangulata TaxID=200361 RepID=UPI003CC8D35F
MSSNIFIAEMKSLGDELAAAGRSLSDLEMGDYILVGLDWDYDPIIVAVGAIKNSITVDDLFSKISAFDRRMEMFGDGPTGFRSSANAMYIVRGQTHTRGGRGQGNLGRGRGDRPSHSPARGGGGGGYQQRQRQPPQQQQQQHQGDYPECQICYKCHAGGARACWHLYEEDHEEKKKANLITNSYGIDTNWYADSGATEHITGELDKLTMRERYREG